MRYKSVRALLAAAALENLEIVQFDVKTDFVYRRTYLWRFQKDSSTPAKTRFASSTCLFMDSRNLQVVENKSLPNV